MADRIIRERTFEDYERSVFYKIQKIKEKIKDKTEKMEWIIDFANTDKSEYSQGQVKVLREEVEFLKDLVKEIESWH